MKKYLLIILLFISILLKGQVFSYYTTKVNSSPIPTANLKLWLEADYGVVKEIDNTIILHSPKGMSGLVCWLRADSLINKDVNNYVSAQGDCSGSSNGATQPTGANQPLWVDNAMNGNPVLRYNGTSSYEIGTTIAGLNTSSITIFVVTSGAVYNGGGDWSTMFQIGCYSTEFNLARWGSVHGFEVANSTTGAGGLYSSNSLLDAGYSATCLEYIKNYRQKAWIIKDGVVLNSTTSSTNVGTFTNANYYISYKNVGCYTEYYKGDIAEMIIFNRVISETEKIQIEKYLQNKYNTASISYANNNVIKWSDKSGNNNDAIDDKAFGTPIYIANQLNGLPVITFDGLYSYLKGTNINHIGDSSLTVFAVVNGNIYNGGEATSPIFSIGCYSSDSKEFVFGRNSTNQNFSVFNTGLNTLSSSTNSLLNSGFTYKLLEYSKTINSISKIWINSIFSNSTTNSTNVGTFTNANYYIPILSPDVCGNGSTYNGNIVALIIYMGDMTDAKRASIETYLNGKYLLW